MNKTSRFKHAWLIFAVLGLILILVTPTELFARAGGGGGGGSSGGRGGGILKAIFLILYLIYAGFLWLLIRRRENQATSLIAKLAKIESSWEQESIKRRVHEVFFKIQKAWTERDQAIAKDCASENLNSLHDEWKLAEMRTQHERNVLEDIQLHKLQIVEIADYLDDTKDRLWVVVHGSMIDYVVDEQTREVIRGSKSKAEKFKELWKFTCGKRGWALDEIDQDVEFGDLMDFKSSTEERL